MYDIILRTMIREPGFNINPRCNFVSTYGTLFCYWSVYLSRWNISPRIRKATAPCSVIGQFIYLGEISVLGFVMQRHPVLLLVSLSI